MFGCLENSSLSFNFKIHENKLSINWLMINLIRLRWWTLSKHDLNLGVLILPAACCWAFWSGSTALGSAPTGSPPGRWAPVWRRRRRRGRWAQRGGRSWRWWETCWATADSLFSASFIHHPLPPPSSPLSSPSQKKSNYHKLKRLFCLFLLMSSLFSSLFTQRFIPTSPCLPSLVFLLFLHLFSSLSTVSPRPTLMMPWFPLRVISSVGGNLVLVFRCVVR